LATNYFPYILSRHSVRNYEQRVLDPADLARVELILRNTKSRFSGNKFSVILKSKEKGEDLVSILGAYGRFITPPYYLLPYLIGENHSLADLGYQTEQIAIQLWSKGIGSCFIGCLSRRDVVRMKFQLPPSAHVAAFLVIGYPAGDSTGFELFTRAAKTVMGIRNRLAVEEICFMDSFEQPCKPDGKWENVIEAARMSPSAVNAQPWRFLLHNDVCYFFAVQDQRKYLLPENKDYSLHDSGICMANMDMALTSLGIKGNWTFLDGLMDVNIPHPEKYYPFARLILNQTGE
jgi:nitroreductase